MNPIREYYFDCAATAPILPCAMEAFTVWPYANPNAVHSPGRDARGDLEQARKTVARCINAEPEEIYFTPSATSACRSAVELLEIGNCSAHEHKAVADACIVQRVSQCESVSFAHILASNETGEIFTEVVGKAVSTGIPVFTDATAAMGHIPIDVKALGVAALAAGGHKFGAPPGIGFLYVKDGVAEYKISERDFSYPGTPPVALALALASALEYRTSGRIYESLAYLHSQQYRFATALLGIPGAHINCMGKPRLPNILSVRFDGVNARELLTLMDVNGVCASAGSACHAEDDQPSAALLAAGLTEEQARSTIRLSWCEETPPDDFDFTAGVIADCVERLRTLGGIPMPR